MTILFVSIAAIMVLVGVRVWQMADRSVITNRWVAHSYEVESQAASVLARSATLQAAAFAYAVTGDSAQLSSFTSQLSLLDTESGALLKLVEDNPEQTKNAHNFVQAVVAQRDKLGEMVEARRSSGKPPATFDPNVVQVRALYRYLLTQEDELLIDRRVATEHAASLTRLLTSGAMLASLVFLAMTYWFIRSAHSRTARSQTKLRAANAQLASALDETRHLSESLQKLGHLGEVLQSCRSLDEVREGLGGALVDLLPALGGRLALINPSQNLAAIGAHWGQHGLIAESVFPPEDCWALRRGQAYPLAGASNGFVCRHVHYPNPDLPDAGYLCVPLAAQGEMIGVLTFDGNHAPTQDERRMALAIGEQLALALANLRLQDTLRTQSIRDPLTGLFNRRYLEVSLERELLRAARRSHPLAVLMLDVDHFKRFNDSHGHEAGDALLGHFAEALKRSTRSEDIACRYGGEEFTVVLLESDAATAAQRAEQIRAAVSEMTVMYRQQQLEHVTVSIGVAVFPQDGRTPDDLLRRADAALYVAKKAGRNRVVAAQPEKSTVAT
ncbi:MAG TPA: diguanylate cyclase [Rudaea sp.]